MAATTAVGRMTGLLQSFRDDLAAGLPVDRVTTGVNVRTATGSETSGQRILTRAAITTALGGGVIALVSAAFGTRMFAADARIWGLFCGLAIVALGVLAPVGADSRKLVHGAIVIVLGIVSFPIALGGYVFGAIATIVGGAMLVAYEPPVGQVSIQTERAGTIRRVAALIVDFAVAFVAQRILYLLAGSFFTNTVNVVMSWLIVWFVVAVEPAILSRRTPGKLLLSIRTADWRTGHRSSTWGAAVRETIRGAVVVGTLFAVWAASLRDSFEGLRGLLMLLVIIGLVALAEAADIVGRLSGTMSAYDVVVDESDTEPTAEPNMELDVVAAEPQ